MCYYIIFINKIPIFKKKKLEKTKNEIYIS